jgi:nicotinamidase-related amidase
MKALCIIDMQYFYNAAKSNSVARAVCREIRAAKEQGIPIFVVEYGSQKWRRTRPMILKEIGRYPHRHRVIKQDIDGSYELMAAMMCVPDKIDHLRVCGVETNVCVEATILNLLKRMPGLQVELVADACNSARYREGYTTPGPGQVSRVVVEEHLQAVKGGHPNIQIV